MTNEEYKGVSDDTLRIWAKAAREERDALKVKLDLHNAESVDNDWEVQTTWWADTRARIRDLGRMEQAIQAEQGARKRLTAARNLREMLSRTSAKRKQPEENGNSPGFTSRLIENARRMLDPETFDALIASSRTGEVK